ncbi:glycoside hydrolase family 3 N-terminal domain-containing protein [Janibacter sp. DB-40]|uniref:glycoside hydrolase family 3 N-terminal domain-containing protein n=1 Tax=Janibacter sp. DB-40 TaxID=3028808 RepID=UPI00240646F5|nr:glycoside hydrolase family 3 N-terminal domain-containing protein [Janibacter sp. DB-40]
MSRRPHALPRIAAGAAALALVGCGGSGSPEPSSTGGSSTSSTSSSPSGSSDGGATTEAQADSCVTDVREAMTPTQQAGQLLMAAMNPGPVTGLDGPVSDQGLGSMLYLGGWQGSQTVAAASEHLQQMAPTVDGTKVGMIVSADQEGGEVQQLTGAGFSSMPSGLQQAQLPDLRSAAKGWGGELAAAGVNVNLAPVADTVPTAIGQANDPIGQWGRQYGSTPEAAGAGALAFARGMQDAGVEPTVKHFPGIGRITGNTDLTTEGITDTEMTTDDSHLQAFETVIDGGTKIVMIGSARYAKIDPGTPAVFSDRIIEGMLRQDLGFDGVVITDDVGTAAAVQATPVAERATKFIAAGGDIVLTVEPEQVPTMTSAIIERAKGDEAFAEKVEESVTRVLTLKEEMGLLDCG